MKSLRKVAAWVSPVKVPFVECTGYSVETPEFHHSKEVKLTNAQVYSGSSLFKAWKWVPKLSSSFVSNYLPEQRLQSLKWDNKVQALNNVTSPSPASNEKLLDISRHRKSCPFGVLKMLKFADMIFKMFICMLYIFKYQKESMTIMRNKVDVIRNSQIETQDMKYTVFYMKLLIQKLVSRKPMWAH